MASFLDYYALSYNPFNKQSMKEKEDRREMDRAMKH